MILTSVITYELSKRLGKVAAQELFTTETSSALETPGQKPCCQAVNVVKRLRKLADVAVLHDAGGTSIGHARSRAFSVAHKSAVAGLVDIWLSVDDDTECSDETLRHLLGAMDPETPQVVIVPCWLRQETPIVNITLDPDAPLARVTSTGARLVRALYGGFGIVAVTRAAILELGEHWRDLTFLDDDGEERVGLFCEFIRDGWWYRDDYAFFSRVPEHIRIEALLTGLTDHDGKRLRLETVEQHAHIPRPKAFARRDTVPPPGEVELCPAGRFCTLPTGHDGKCQFAEIASAP